MPKLAHSLAANSRPRGIVLLIILSLLSLFAMMMITLALVANHAVSSSVASLQIEQHGDPPEPLLEEALLQLLRGTDKRSPIGIHSLLEDVYGNMPISRPALDINSSGFGTGDIVHHAWPQSTQRLPAAGNGALLGIEIDLHEASEPSWGLDKEKFTPDDLIGHFAGRVLTMVTGKSAGKSTMIVAYLPYDEDKSDDSSLPTKMMLWMLPFQDMVWNDSTKEWEGDVPTDGSFMIGGRPFGGPGAGFTGQLAKQVDNTIPEPDAFSENNLLGLKLRQAIIDTSNNRLKSDADRDAADKQYSLLTIGGENIEMALTPNYANLHVAKTVHWLERDDIHETDDANNSSGDYPDYGPLRDNPPWIGYHANEPYDAVDYQNMFLSTGVERDDGEIVIPSFHRPNLIEYWVKRKGFSTFAELLSNHPQLAHMIMLRPIKGAGFHPNFTGSSNFDPDAANPVWDVDNDGNGVADSIWLDLGFPVQTTSDGRHYKPLVAILCIDLDGRLNLNAHGNLAQALLARQHTGDSSADKTPSTDAAGTLDFWKYLEQFSDQSTADFRWTVDLGNNHFFADGLTKLLLPRGLGATPGEINLGALFNSGSDAYARLLLGRGWIRSTPTSWIQTATRLRLPSQWKAGTASCRC